MSTPFWVKGDLKRSSGCYKSTFKNKNNPQRKLVFSATRAAFLALLSLKLKNMKIMQWKNPKEPKNVKKL